MKAISNKEALDYAFAWTGETAHKVKEYMEQRGQELEDMVTTGKKQAVEGLMDAIVAEIPDFPKDAALKQMGFRTDDSYYEDDGVMFVEVKTASWSHWFTGDEATMLYNRSSEAQEKLKEIDAKGLTHQEETLSGLKQFDERFDDAAAIKAINHLVRLDGTFLEEFDVLLLFINKPPRQAGNGVFGGQIPNIPQLAAQPDQAA